MKIIIWILKMGESSDMGIVKARIADLHVLMRCKTKYMVHRLQEYVYDFDGPAQIEIDIPEVQIQQYCKDNAQMHLDSAEYILSGAWFYSKLYREYNGFMLHASAVCMDGQGYLFSANSGTGKSTHTQLWTQHFGARAHVINDDKPALRRMQDGWWVYGTPWSGKTALNENIGVPLKAIAFLHRSAENQIKRMEGAQIITNLLEQTIRSKTEAGVETMFALFEDLLSHTPVYSLGCNMSPEAAQFAYEEMKK